MKLIGLYCIGLGVLVIFIGVCSLLMTTEQARMIEDGSEA